MTYLPILIVSKNLAHAPSHYLVVGAEASGGTRWEAGEYLFSALLDSSYLRQMQANNWHAELTLTARLRFSTHLHALAFDRAAPLHICFPREAILPHIVEMWLEELEVAEHV